MENATTKPPIKGVRVPGYNYHAVAWIVLVADVIWEHCIKAWDIVSNKAHEMRPGSRRGSKMELA